MSKLYAYVKKERHTFEFTMLRKGRWMASCSCRKMLDKTGSRMAVEEQWRDHVKQEGERLEVEVFWYEYG